MNITEEVKKILENELNTLKAKNILDEIMIKTLDETSIPGKFAEEIAKKKEAILVNQKLNINYANNIEAYINQASSPKNEDLSCEA